MTGHRQILSPYRDGGPADARHELDGLGRSLAAWLGRPLWCVRAVGRETSRGRYWIVSHVHEQPIAPTVGPHRALPLWLVPRLADWPHVETERVPVGELPGYCRSTVLRDKWWRPVRER